MRIAVTGGYACGKTTVAKLLARRGAKRLDADAIAKRCASRSAAVRAAFPEAFPSGRFSAKRMSGIIFSSPSRRRRLERIVHPLVAERLAAQRGDVVAEVPLLFEAGMEKLFDVVVVVKAPMRLRLARAKLKRGEAVKRIAAQTSLSQKAKRADYVISNDGGIAALKRAADSIWDDLHG